VAGKEQTVRGEYGQAMTQNSVELAVIRAWIDADPDPVTRDEMEKLITKNLFC
jgi:hypothetical protein